MSVVTEPPTVQQTPLSGSSGPRSRPKGKAGRSTFDYFTGVVSIALSIVIVGPLAGTVWNIVTGQEGSIREAFFRVFGSRLWEVLGYTILILGLSILISMAVGTGLAWLNERTNARVGWASDVLPVVSLLVPSTAGAIGWVLLASPDVGYLNVIVQGIADFLGVSVPQINIYSVAGMIFVFSLYLIPQVYLVVSAAMRNIDPALEEAARVSGRGTWEVVRDVTLPAVRPAIISGGLLALVYGLAMYSIPLFLGSQAGITVLTVEIVRLLTVAYPPDMLGATLLCVLLLMAVLLMNALSRAVNKSGKFATIGGKPAGQSGLKLRAPIQALARIGMFGYMVMGCVLPVVALFYVALQPYWSGAFTTNLQFDAFQEIFSQGSQTFDALRNSLFLGVATATIGMFLAICVSYQMSVNPRFSGALNVVTKIPGTVSNVIIAIALLSVFAGPPFNLGGTVAILFIAYLTLYITQASVSAESAFLQVGKDLTDASRVSGYGPGATMAKVALPLMAPGLTAGWVFVFVLVMGDITASAILAGTNNPVVGFTMLSLFQNGTYTTLAALGAVVTVLSMIVVLSALAWAGRSRSKMSR